MDGYDEAHHGCVGVSEIGLGLYSNDCGCGVDLHVYDDGHGVSLNADVHVYASHSTI